MMRRLGAPAYVAAHIGVAACGGNVKTVDQDSNQSDAAGQTPPIDGGAAGIDAHRNPYIPSGDAASVDDADPLAGATDTPGFGFDLCSTRTPGKVTLVDTPPPAQGDRFVRFTTGTCENACQGPSDAQLYAWPTAPHSFDVLNGLYLDMIDLRAQPSSGSMRIYGTDEVCEANVLLMEVPLAALAIERAWSLRCIPLRPGTVKAIGLAVTAGDYDIGIDAIRFGQWCH